MRPKPSKETRSAGSLPFHNNYSPWYKHANHQGLLYSITTTKQGNYLVKFNLNIINLTMPREENLPERHNLRSKPKAMTLSAFCKVTSFTDITYIKINSVNFFFWRHDFKLNQLLSGFNWTQMDPLHLLPPHLLCQLNTKIWVPGRFGAIILWPLRATWM